jgi:predicted small integral membrane protein
MTVRACKTLLVAAVALYYTLVVFNNLTDYNSNYLFVHHVLSMDTTFPGNHGMWRTIMRPLWQYVFYDSIIAWEAITMVLCWWGVVHLTRALKGSARSFEAAKRLPVAALTLSLLMWLVAFLSVGAEWFLMWQSRLWNGQEEAFRMFAVVGVVMLILLQPERSPD